MRTVPAPGWPGWLAPLLPEGLQLESPFPKATAATKALVSAGLKVCLFGRRPPLSDSRSSLLIFSRRFEHILFKLWICFCNTCKFVQKLGQARNDYRKVSSSSYSRGNGGITNCHTLQYRSGNTQLLMVKLEGVGQQGSDSVQPALHQRQCEQHLWSAASLALQPQGQAWFSDGQGPPRG